MTAGRICVRDVDLAESHESVQAAAARMHARNVGSLIVANAHKKPVGIVTDRDLVVKVLAHGRNPFQTTVGEIMTLIPRCITEDTGLEDAIAVMRSGPYRRLPVINETGQLVGVLSLDDVLRLLADELHEIGRLIERETPDAVT